MICCVWNEPGPEHGRSLKAKGKEDFLGGLVGRGGSAARTPVCTQRVPKAVIVCSNTQHLKN